MRPLRYRHEAPKGEPAPTRASPARAPPKITRAEATRNAAGGGRLVQMALLRILAAAALSAALAVPATAGAAERRAAAKGPSRKAAREAGAPPPATARRSRRYWGATPCGGRITFIARQPRAAGLGANSYAWVTFASPLGANNLAAPAEQLHRLHDRLRALALADRGEHAAGLGMFCTTMVARVGPPARPAARHHAGQRDGARLHRLLERAVELPRRSAQAAERAAPAVIAEGPRAGVDRVDVRVHFGASPRAPHLRGCRRRVLSAQRGSPRAGCPSPSCRRGSAPRPSG